MINKVDHASNYCRVFVARMKDLAAQMFEYFLTFSWRFFDCKVRILMTEGVDEYCNFDMFSMSTGLIRQVSESNDQASDGKAERIHKPLLTWRDA